jgi:predicted homoserine dehydrogenase-like protein
MTANARLTSWAAAGGQLRVAVVGAGFMGRGLLSVLERRAGLVPALVVNRTPERAVEALVAVGVARESIVVSDDANRIADSIASGRRAVTTNPEAAAVAPVELVIEATLSLGFAARAIMAALAAGRDVISLNAELHATLGSLLIDHARRHGAVYTVADGDQHGVLLRQLDAVEAMGFELVAALNCKRNLDVRQDPDSSRPYAERDGTTLAMTTSAGDGTKMQIENAVVANLSGLVPDRRGMHGVPTTLERVVADVVETISQRGVVEYTLGGDFGGGVAVIGYADDSATRHYMRYVKMGDGPYYLFFRPYHLLHFEVTQTIAAVLLDRQSVGSPPPGPPVAEVVAIAKRPLEPGTPLDGIGGFAAYGHVDTVAGAEGLLPIGLADHATLIAPVGQDEPIPLAAVELDEQSEVVRLRRRQDEATARFAAG